MRLHTRRTVRRMPRVYGNLQPAPRQFGWLRRLLRGGVLFGITGGILYGLFFSGSFVVRTVQVEDAVLSSASQVAATVPLHRSIFLLQTGDIARAIQVDQRIRSVRVWRGLPDTVSIVVTEKVPALIWESGNAAYLLDTNGHAFARYVLTDDGQGERYPAAETPAGQLLARVPRVTDTKGLPVEVGQAIAGPGFLQFVTATQSAFAEYLPEVQIARMEVAETTYDLTVVSGSGLRAELSTIADPLVQVRNLTRLIRQGKVSLTATVDLRVNRWAYVR